MSRTEEFHSNLFVVPKKDGGWCPLINLKSPNMYFKKFHFKIEEIQNLKDTLSPNDYMAKLDLKDAYLGLPMHSQAQKYLLLGQQCVRISVPNIWTIPSIRSFHQAAETSCHLFEETRNQNISVLGQYASDGPLRGRAGFQCPKNPEPSWLHPQYKGVCQTEPHQTIVFGILSGNDCLFPARKSTKSGKNAITS